MASQLDFVRSFNELTVRSMVEVNKRCFHICFHIAGDRL